MTTKSNDYEFVKRSRKGESYFYCSICQKDCNIESMGVSAITAYQNCKAPGMAPWGHCVQLPPTRNGKKCKKLP